MGRRCGVVFCKVSRWGGAFLGTQYDVKRGKESRLCANRLRGSLSNTNCVCRGNPGSNSCLHGRLGSAVIGGERVRKRAGRCRKKGSGWRRSGGWRRLSWFGKAWESASHYTSFRLLFFLQFFLVGGGSNSIRTILSYHHSQHFHDFFFLC